jgi:hypothetical protein
VGFTTKKSKRYYSPTRVGKCSEAFVPSSWDGRRTTFRTHYGSAESNQEKSEDDGDGLAGQGSKEGQQSSANQWGKMSLSSQGNCSSTEASWTTYGSEGREWVSFGTNMSTEEDVSDDGAEA